MFGEVFQKSVAQSPLFDLLTLAFRLWSLRLRASRAFWIHVRTVALNPCIPGTIVQASFFARAIRRSTRIADPLIRALPSPPLSLPRLSHILPPLRAVHGCPDGAVAATRQGASPVAKSLTRVP